MNARKIFIFVMLCFVMVAYQNCGAGLLPGQDIYGFQSNGGGYSGFGDRVNSELPTAGTRDSFIDINNGECTGKITSYHLVDESCPAVDYSDEDWDALLQSQSFTLNGQGISLPVETELQCKEFISKYVLIVDSCEDTIKGYVGNGSTVTIDGLFYRSFGIKYIYASE